MSRASFRSKIITGFILVIACFALAYLLATPQWDKYKIAKNQLEVAVEQEQQLSESLAAIDSFVNTFNNSSTSVGITNQALPPRDSDTAGFVSSLSALAGQSGVVLGDMQFEEQASNDKQAAPNSIRVIKVNMTASGTYLSFKDFMLRLENHLRLVDVQKITLASDDSGVLRYQLILTTYYQK